MPGSLGGGAIIALAAVLWLLYLTPSWVRRRQYLETERNAMRLQESMRQLSANGGSAATARTVVEEHRKLRAATRGAESIARSQDAAAARQLQRRSERTPREPRQRANAVAVVAASRLRRTRLLATAVLVAAFGLIGFGLVSVSRGASWVPLVLGVVALLGAVAVLQRAATVAAARRAVTAVDHAVSMPEAPQSFTDWQRSEQVRPTWTPVPIPRPLYLDRAEGPSGPQGPGAAAAVAQAAADADAALRAAHAAPEVADLDRPARRRPPAASANLPAGVTQAAGGRVETPESGPVLSDLDAVLRRRRAG